MPVPRLMLVSVLLMQNTDNCRTIDISQSPDMELQVFTHVTIESHPTNSMVCSRSKRVVNNAVCRFKTFGVRSMVTDERFISTSSMFVIVCSIFEDASLHKLQRHWKFHRCSRSCLRSLRRPIAMYVMYISSPASLVVDARTDGALAGFLSVLDQIIGIRLRTSSSCHSSPKQQSVCRSDPSEKQAS